jgi:putative transposase
MTDYRRFRHPGVTWFFTVNLAERRSNRLLVDRINILREAFVQVKKDHPFVIEAIVVFVATDGRFRFFNPLGLD